MNGEDHLEPWKDFVNVPLPPSTGQIFSYLIRNLGGFVAPLSSKTLQRFFNETEDFKVPNKTKAEILDALAEWLEETGLVPCAPQGSTYQEHGGVRTMLEVFVSEWESWRAFTHESRLEVPKAILPSIWAPYLRLATIDLAIRIAASLSFSLEPAKRFRVLEYSAAARPGEFLKQVMKDAGDMTRRELVDALEKESPGAVDNWLDHDAKPHSDSIVRLAQALAKRTPGIDQTCIETDLRRLYLLYDIKRALSGHVSDELLQQCATRLIFYTNHIYGTLRAWNEEGQDETAARFIQSFGAKSQWARPFLQSLYAAEQDSTWREDLQVVNGPWHTRVIDASRRAIAAHYKEDRWALRDETLDEFGEHADAIRAYLDKGILSQHQGRFEDSFADLNRIPNLDLENAALHEFVGTVKRDWGALKRNKGLLEEAAQSFWLAVTLDRDRPWAWTALGHTLILLERPGEALELLESIRDELKTLDSRFFNVLSHAYRSERRLDESLGALEESIRLSPDDYEIPLLAAEVCLLRVDYRQAKRYARNARRLGLPEAEFRKLMNAAEHLENHGPPWPQPEPLTPPETPSTAESSAPRSRWTSPSPPPPSSDSGNPARQG